MPRNMMSDFSGMVREFPPNCQFGNFGKNSLPESGKGRPGRRSSTLEEDESLRYLSHEEKDVLLFFEETIEALEDDLEEQALRRHSPRSMQQNASSHLEPEDIIDLVRSVPENSDRDFVHSRQTEAGLEEVWKLDKHRPECNHAVDGNVPADAVVPFPVFPSAPSLPMYEAFPATVPAQHPKLLRSVPTPLVIAQKISENQGEGNLFSPGSPKERKSAERRTPNSSPKQNGGRFTAFKPSVPPPTAPKPLKFPSNINITNLSEREFSKTISRAAVSVQERKAQVLANVNGSAFVISELEERLQKYELSGPSRSSSLRDLPSEQARHEALSKLGLAEETLVQAEAQLEKPPSAPTPKDEKPGEAQALSNGYRNIHDLLKREPNSFPNVSKTMTFKPDMTLVDGKLTRQNAAKSFYDRRQPDFALEMRRRAGSLPRPSGLRPQGVTVQFSGRGSTEEARREALRKLGLLKE
ncbi:proline and serine-rich protein 2 [Eublepharis macularius]|uniref:Proline and serine-rich protein 2 n=1 Tax=Eublepharis macularius TaxID=481883 RepID=A0AA97L7I3_EUBMA|nr:proline and serine-rich protein 2 [Eublepharis macularius]XP_054845104.1 proline and serine-rich protein 2 [Eublepharis macularius]